jgi:hypothetical protein
MKNLNFIGIVEKLALMRFEFVTFWMDDGDTRSVWWFQA